MLTDTEIKILEERLDFAPTQLQINEAELKQDFKDFCRRLRLKWYSFLSLVKLQHFQQNLAKTLPVDTPA